MLVRVGDGRGRIVEDVRVIQAIHGGLVPHREPLAVGVDRELNRRVAELSLDVRRALAPLEQ